MKNTARMYPRSAEPSLSRELFQNPPCEYRGAPFWAWNCALKDETLLRQIDIFRQMGMGGFHMHVRTGMDSPYLTDEYMAHIRLCVEKAKKEGMRAFLYDEDRWPSGTAGGLVTRNPDFAMRYLMFTHTPYGAYKGKLTWRMDELSGHEPVRTEKGIPLAAYDVTFDGDQRLSGYRRIDPDAKAEGEKWYAYLETALPSAWINGYPYADTLSADAAAAFRDITHERYRETVGDEFGRTIPSIFTDEPQFARKTVFAGPEDKQDLFIPWTLHLPDFYREMHGGDILSALPELFWELPAGRVSAVRWKWHDAVTELFVRSYLETLGSWCEKNGIRLGGHIMGEPTLSSQTGAIGEAMRCYRAFKNITGIDMLCDFHEYNTAKQAQSAMRQQGGEAMMSELYGVTGWDYDFRGHKLQGDWQAALGVTVRVPHLTWMSMAGEAKRDYPASIGCQSPWYGRYSLIEDHFARIAAALTRGKPLVRVGVIHPIESYWLLWGPASQTATDRSQMENRFSVLTETLLFGQVDFDFICESTLPSLCTEASAPLAVGEMSYGTVIVPSCRTLRKTTIDRLRSFSDAGGRLIFLGEAPQYADAEESSLPAALYASAEHAPFEPAVLLSLLQRERELEILYENGSRCDRLLYQLRQDGSARWLFIANGKNPVSPDTDPSPTLRFSVRGEWSVTLYDTLSGSISPLSAEAANGRTVFRRVWHMHDSLLLRLDRISAVPQSSPSLPKAESFAPARRIPVPKRVPVSLSEPNVLILDTAEYSLDGSAFEPEEDILRADNRCREALLLPPRKKFVEQPYKIKKRPCVHSVTLRMTILSEQEQSGTKLALERAAQSRITLNGREVPAVTEGWYVDEAIQTVRLPTLIEGENLLTVTQMIGEREGLEYLYLLGDFGVRVEGSCKTLTPPVRTLSFGDVTRQGLPFYTGNITYFLTVQTQNEALSIRAPHYRGALIEAEADGVYRGDIVFSPYSLTIDRLTPGTHTLALMLYGTRQNGFGQLHHTQGVYFYQSADSWRSSGDLWTEAYQLRPVGILKAPEIMD